MREDRTPGEAPYLEAHAARPVLTIALALVAALALSCFDIGLQTWGRQAGAAKFLPAVFLCTGLFSCGFLPWADGPRRLWKFDALGPLGIGTFLIAVQAMSMSYALGRFGDAARINIVYALRGLWAVALAWLLARTFGGPEAHHSPTTMLLRLAGAALLTLAVLIALRHP